MGVNTAAVTDCSTHWWPVDASMPGRLRRALADVPLPRAADGRLVLAVDGTCWLRPVAHISPKRILGHTYGRGKDKYLPRPALLDHPHTGAGSQLPNRTPERTTSQARRGHDHGHRTAAARSAPAPDQRGAMADRRPGYPPSCFRQSEWRRETGPALAGHVDFCGQSVAVPGRGFTRPGAFSGTGPCRWVCTAATQLMTAYDDLLTNNPLCGPTLVF
jgi:hypothetical protein